MSPKGFQTFVELLVINQFGHFQYSIEKVEIYYADVCNIILYLNGLHIEF